MSKQQEFRKQTEEAKLEAFSLMCRKVADLEAEVKEWKDKADLWCKTANLKDHNIMINKELEKENAELKKEVEKHKWNDIFLEDCAVYDKKIAEEYTTSQERIEELEKENAELKEQCSILADCNTCVSDCKTENIEIKTQLTKAKEIIKAFLDSSDLNIKHKAEEFLGEF